MSGTENYAEQLSNMISRYLVENFSTVQQLDTPTGLKKARIYCDLLKYIIPRAVPKREKETRVEDLSTDKMREIVDDLRQKLAPRFSLASQYGLNHIADPQEFVKELLKKMGE